MRRAISILVHADTKVGKSTFGNTTPTPRLILDAEAAYRFLPGRKTFWNPRTEAPPAAGDWETCVAVIREYQDMVSAAAWLQSGQHCFKSVTVDSISELQKKCIDQLAGLDNMDQRLWGQLLRHMEALVRQLRDLTEHPTMPVEAVVLTAMTTNRDGKWRPYVQGQLAVTMPYFLDVIGYMYVETVPHPDPTQPGTKVRRMLVTPHNQFEAGERVQGRLGDIVEEPTVMKMLDMVFGSSQEGGTA